MKHTTYILTAAALLFSMQASAQTNPRVSSPAAAIEGETLRVKSRLEASGLKLKSSQNRTVEFYLTGENREVMLPSVVYTGKQRYRFERRNRSLSEAYSLTPYKVYKPVKKNQTYTLDYDLTVPYEPWMDHAALGYRITDHTCGGPVATANQTLIADLGLSNLPSAVNFEPNPALYPQMVSFLTPEVEAVKSRAASLALNIDFPKGAYDIREGFGRNAGELRRVDSLMKAVSNSGLTTLSALNIVGYASPEGSYKANETLAQRRAVGFQNYLKSHYSVGSVPVNTTSVAEDWKGLAAIVAASDMPYKSEMMGIMADPTLTPDPREAKLKALAGGAVYPDLLNNIYPRLRRIELTTDYVVSQFSDAQAKELMYSRPELLSLNEMFRVANGYQPGTAQYKEAWRIAASQYPESVIANNNAAASLLREGDAKGAQPYLVKIKDDTRSFVNQGVYSYITGDVETALSYFRVAAEMGDAQAKANLEKILGQ